MKPPLPRFYRLIVLVGVPIIILLAVAAALTDEPGWGLALVYPFLFMLGYVARDIDVR